LDRQWYCCPGPCFDGCCVHQSRTDFLIATFGIEFDAFSQASSPHSYYILWLVDRMLRCNETGSLFTWAHWKILQSDQSHRFSTQNIGPTLRIYSLGLCRDVTTDVQRRTPPVIHSNKPGICPSIWWIVIVNFLIPIGSSSVSEPGNCYLVPCCLHLPFEMFVLVLFWRDIG
jgi:hypothetical protein